jgi:2-polyprenyl-3-methyl-5-hydroxy-6-metoxy-1,4-benzoquinol methylase
LPTPLWNRETALNERRLFHDRCVATCAHLGHQGTSYLAYHDERLYATWRLCRRFLTGGRTLLSFGAGSAYVESALAAEGTDVTVVDFPEAIRLNAAYYQAAGLNAVAADLSDPAPLALGEFDVVLAAEIIEHVPAAPSELFRRWSNSMSPGGHLIVSTPNLGSVSSFLRLLFMRPLLPPPEATFGSVSFENEGVHRREYMPSEIVSAFHAAGLRPESIAYSVNSRARGLREASYVPFHIVPRLRPTMILAAAK